MLSGFVSSKQNRPFNNAQNDNVDHKTNFSQESFKSILTGKVIGLMYVKVNLTKFNIKKLFYNLANNVSHHLKREKVLIHFKN